MKKTIENGSEKSDELMMFTNQEAASISQSPVSFSFGKNWKQYLDQIDQAAIHQAQKSFTAFTRLKSLNGQTFLDLGCGSGLSSLVAYRLGARRVVSIDVDPNSLDCTKALRSGFAGDAKNWDVIQGSVLDAKLLGSLGHFSYVYSWGVLHHTGAMWEALEKVIPRVEPGGILHIALYNEHKHSAKWLKIKKVCNRFPNTIFPVLMFCYEAMVYARLIARFQSPVRHVREYKQRRGMDFRTDIKDWLGGLPYEYCKPDDAVNFLSDRGFTLSRLRTSASTGCNEFLFSSPSR